jgi:AhpD family alkylhydroperoxidase
MDAKTRHTITLAVSHAYGCDYCLAVHTAASLQGGMSKEDIELRTSGKLDRPGTGRRGPFRAPGDRDVR